MNKPLSVILIFFFSSNVLAEGKTEAQYTAEVLDSFCVQNQDNFDNIAYMATSIGGRILPNEEADPVMRELGGKTVHVPYEGRDFIVAFANGGGCTVVAKDIDLQNLKKLLNKYFQIELLDQQNSLAQVNEFLRVGASGIYQGAVLSLVYAQPETGYTEGSISFIPASTVRAAR